MKKYWLVLLSLGLVMAFSVSAFAVDVKVGAEYYVGGLYLNKTSLNDTAYRYDDSNTIMPAANESTAFFYQRLRVGTDFVVSPCLKLVTQFDAMERIWGGARSNTWQINQQPIDPYAAADFSAGTRAETENIAFNMVYIDYTSPIGLFKVGYMPDYTFGTVFADMGSGLYDGQIQYFVPVGPVTLFAGYSKRVDNSYSAVSSTSWYWLNNLNATRTDRDYDSYRVAGIYNFKSGQVSGETGLLFLWDRDASHRGDASGAYLTNLYVADPYVKAKIGPVALQAELLYYFGDAAKYEYGGPTINIGALSVFVDATATFGPAYVGGTFAYLSGDDPTSTDKIEGGINNGGLDWNPCLIMFNTETLGYWVGPVMGYDGSVVDNVMNNAWFFQGRVGVKPTPQWDVMLSLSYATADKKPLNYANSSYGTEVDLTATYKITNNLSYMLGGAYLFTGDYFKGFDPNSNYKVDDDYMLINKLTLNF